MNKTIWWTLLAGITAGFLLPAVAQTRVVVLPFRNMDGEVSLNVWSFDLADSLRRMLVNTDPAQTAFVMIPQDSVDLVTSEFNLDPTNVQFESDVWRAVAKLKADKVVQGNFFRRGGRVLMNAYVYDVEFKMADPEYQAKNLYKTPETVLDVVPDMAKKLYPALLKPLP
ncbi:MAG: hypothetical protein AMXMBFR68_19600 [Ignavibacteria bacterium]|nr:hypothetical protein [Ignavibacteria bacterium]QOJ26797.1 MAG: hypothetical protein HRU79_09130 [Ignavibacteria bacterium]